MFYTGSNFRYFDKPIFIELRDQDGSKRAPDFIIIGQQKCSSTALRFFLAANPKLKSPKDPQEVHFFERDRNFKKGYKERLLIVLIPIKVM